MPHRLIWSLIPVLPYEDADQTLTFYRRLGFATAHVGSDYFVVERGGLELHLGRVGVHAPHTAANCYMRTPDIDRLHAEFVASFDAPIDPAVEMPWHMREFELRDPFGNHLRFGQPSSE
ncbi:MAG: glyoxalase [Hyphomicrobiales bacterium]|nr:glyoxalase [Hyphomicrobiales bacterium]